MNGKRNRSSRSFRRWAAVAVLWLAGAGGAVFAQNPVVPVINTSGTTAGTTESGVVQTQCSSCSRGLVPDLGVLPTFGGGGCSSCGAGGCGSGQCVPGRTPCDCCIDESTCFGRIASGLYHCICCP